MALASAPTAPRFEHRTDAGPVLGLGPSTPRLSWTVEQADPGWEQTAYEVEVVRNGDAPGLPRRRPGPGAGPVAGAAARLPRARRGPGAGRPRDDLEPVERCRRPSRRACFDRRDWSARFISPGRYRRRRRPAPVLSGPLEVPGEVRSARLYATAHGIYRPSINGRRVDDTVLAPGWTSYEHRLRYHAYDVTHLVQPGPNLVEVLLGNGWYRGRLGYTNDRALYGHRLALLAQLEVTTTTAPSTSWPPTAPGGRARARSWPTTSTTARRPTCGCADRPAPYGRGRGPRRGPAPARRRRTARRSGRRACCRPAGSGPPRRVGRSSTSGRTPWAGCASGCAGWPPGTEVVLRHAEVLEDGELATRPLRTAEATDTWILAGPDEEVLEPSLTLHGFRYAEVTRTRPGARRGRRAGRHRLGPAPDRLVLLLERPPRPVPRERRLEHPRQLRRPADRLPTARRAAGLDRRRPGLRTDRHLPVRHRPVCSAPGWPTSSAEQLPDGSVPHVVPDVNRNAARVHPGRRLG